MEKNNKNCCRTVDLTTASSVDFQRKNSRWLFLFFLEPLNNTMKPEPSLLKGAHACVTILFKVSEGEMEPSHLLSSSLNPWLNPGSRGRDQLKCCN